MATMPQHYLAHLDELASGAYGLISDNDNTDTAVIFVHGFLGDAEGTWLNFQEMIDSCQHRCPAWARCDAYFFSYRSFYDSISKSAEDLIDFLKMIYPKAPQSLCAGSSLKSEILRSALTMRLPQRRYKGLILVGHSEGALVIRRAVCVLYKRSSGRDRALRAKLALFAPAHLGFAPSGWLGACLAIGRVAAVVMPFLKASPPFVDMTSRVLIDQIRSDTSAFLSTSPRLRALRAPVLFGDRERVVVSGEYTGDFPEPLEPGKDHVSVCKPKFDYQRPLNFVLK